MISVRARGDDKIFRQVIGIPMGTSCAPYLANIFLHMYEYDYLRELVEKSEIENARRLANTFRYQDDRIALNDNGEFEKHFSKIYPSEMTGGNFLGAIHLAPIHPTLNGLFYLISRV